MGWRISKAALADLAEIVNYIARDNRSAAEAWASRLLEQAEKACNQPLAGRIVPEINDPNVRESFLRSYRIIYRIEGDSVVVLRVIEGHRRLRSV